MTSDTDVPRRDTAIRSGKDVAGRERLCDPTDQVGLLVDEEFRGFRELGNSRPRLKRHPRDVIEHAERS